jgi:nitrogen regulatory protein PII
MSTSLYPREHNMKLIVAIIRPDKLAAVQKALNKRDICQMTVSHALGTGHERGHSYVYRSTRIEENLISRLKLEVAVDDGSVDSIVQAIRQTAATGHVGDGIIWVSPLEQAVRIRPTDDASWLPHGQLTPCANYG